MPNYRRYYFRGRTVFVTVVTYQRRPWLGEPDNAGLLLSVMRRVKPRLPFRHVAHVILPDHFHWLFVPLDDANFSRIVGAVKREITWRMKGAGQAAPRLWQDRFYDHVVRDGQDFANHLDYVHYNPVKHRVVGRAGDYRFSSFVPWVERGAYDSSWGTADRVPDSVRGLELE